VGVALGGPLLRNDPDKLMTRLALHRHTSDGFRRNVTLNSDANARDEFSARWRLAFNPTASWKWEGAVLFSAIDNGYDEFALDNNGERTFSDQPGRDTQDSVAASLRGTFSGNAVRVTTVTTGSWIDSVYSYDDDWTAASYAGFSYLRRDRTVYSQELRLDSILTRGAAGWIDRWTVGAYLAATDEESAYTNEDPGNVRGLRTGYAAAHQAVFGQVAHDLSDRARITLGLRAERVDLDGAGVRTRFRKGPGTFDPVASFAPAFDDVMVGGKLAVEYDIASNAAAFASLTRGYKGGGINVDARINPAADPLTYETEYLWNIEAGIRGHWLERRLFGEATLFHMTRRHTQVRDSAGFGGSYRFFTDNAGASETYGLEASLTLALTDAWSVQGSLARLESSIDTFTLTNGTVVGGRRLANTPKHGYALALRHSSGERGWFGNVELVGRSRQFDSNNHEEARRAFNVLNGSLGYAWDRWSVSLWTRNLLDERYEKRVFFFGNEDPDYSPARYESRADPRQVGVTVAYHF
jgi:iron complex outermembrane recepter protein